jgi:biopolymer transport protein ExbB
MQELHEAWVALQFGGAMVYPLILLAVVALVLILDKLFVYWRYGRVPGLIVKLVETFGFSWTDLERELAVLGPRSYYGQFIGTIAGNRLKPVWWVESRAADEAQMIEKAFGRGLWVLETIVTAAPLLGLLGTIVGMMNAFKLISGNNLVDPAGVTGGVAQALIATALGLLIALIALFAFNFFSNLQAKTVDDLERIGTRLIDHIRLDAGDAGAKHEAA